MENILNMKLGTIVKREVVVGVSSDEESRQAKDTTNVTVVMEFGADWTVGDLIDRLLSSNSPKVSVQAVLRKMKSPPKRFDWKVNKSGTRTATVDAREVFITFLVGKGFTREQAAMFADNPEALKSAIGDEAE